MAHKKIFVACPIGAEDSEERRRSDKVLRHVIEPVVQDIRHDGTTLDLIRADKTPFPGRISKQMIADIVSCDVMLADLTGDNPNVLYEVGLRQALLKPYILLAERGHKLPFDLADIRTIFYNFDVDVIENTKRQLLTFLQRALNGELDPIDQELLAPRGAREEKEPTGTSPNVQVLEACSKILQEVHSAHDKLASLDRLIERVEGIKTELDHVDYAARYGRGPSNLVNLLRLKDAFHGQAGGQAIGDVLTDVYAQAAEDLYKMTSGNKDSVTFEEYHLVDKFLFKLMEVLPNGSVWLGVTRLQSADAWTKDIAEESYWRFNERVEYRTQANELAYYRLWCFDDVATQDRMAEVLQDQANKNIVTRSCVATDVPDMSLIWVPSRSAESLVQRDAGQLFAKLRGAGFDRLCGIVFKQRGGKELDAMTLYSPKAGRFDWLRMQFEQHWNRAAVVSRQPAT